MRCWKELVWHFGPTQIIFPPRANSSVGSGSFGIIRKVKRKSDGFVRISRSCAGIQEILICE